MENADFGRLADPQPVHMANANAVATVYRAALLITTSSFGSDQGR